MLPGGVRERTNERKGYLPAPPPGHSRNANRTNVPSASPLFGLRQHPHGLFPPAGGTRLRRQRIAAKPRRLLPSGPDNSGSSGGSDGFSGADILVGSGSFDNSSGTSSPNCFDSFSRAGIPNNSGGANILVSPSSPGSFDNSGGSDILVTPSSPDSFDSPNSPGIPGSPGGSAPRSRQRERIRPDRFRGERTAVAAMFPLTMDSAARQTESGQRQQQYD